MFDDLITDKKDPKQTDLFNNNEDDEDDNPFSGLMHQPYTNEEKT